MNDEQKNLLIRQILAIIVGPSLTAYGISATQQAPYVNILSIVIGGLITLGGMVYSQYKTRNAGLVASAATVPKAALDADPQMAAVAATTAAKVEGTTVITNDTVSQAAPSINVVSNNTNRVVAQ